MPIFEYTCQSCNHRFEHLTRADHQAVCPACDGTALEQAALHVRRSRERRGAARRVCRARALRLVRRPTRTRSLLDELNSVSHFFRAFRHRNYQLFFSGQLISLTGTWMQTVAESWLVYRLTGSSVLLGVAAFCSQIPVFVLAPIGGTVADRTNRHRIMVTTQSISMVLPLDPVRADAQRARAGVARVRARDLPRHRQRVRHPRAPVVHRRDGRPGGPAERDRAQLLDGQRRARRRPGGGRDPGGRDRRGVVLPAERHQLRGRDRGTPPDGGAGAWAPASAAFAVPRHGRRVPLRGADRAGPRPAAVARHHELRRHAVRRADAGVRAIDPARRREGTGHPDGGVGHRRTRRGPQPCRAPARPRARRLGRHGGRLPSGLRWGSSRCPARSGSRPCCSCRSAPR